MDIGDGLTDLEVAESLYDNSLPQNRLGIDCPALFSGPVIVVRVHFSICIASDSRDTAAHSSDKRTCTLHLPRLRTRSLSDTR